MNTEFLIYWGLGTVSIFNTIVLFWLALTVLLNAERRTWGIYLAGGGLLLGGAFFLIHTATLDYSWEALLRGVATWWHSSWTCVIALPFGWYVLMLWYAGFWENNTTSLRRRQWPWLLLTTLLAVVLVGLLLLANPLRLYSEATRLAGAGSLDLGSIPWLIFLYPIYLVLCIVLSLDALRHPAAAGHVMGDVARRRARPWLISSSIVQLIVSLLVVALLIVVIMGLLRPQGVINFNSLPYIITISDFVIAALIAVAVVLLGKAVVSYEIFTGKVLPRHGFLRQWRQIVAVAAAYSVLVSLTWALPVRSVYPLLVTMILMSVFFAVFSWRSYTEREQYMAQLRPFVASQGLYEQLVAGEAASREGDHAPDAATPFRALCRDVLGTRLAYLIALGPLAPLVGEAQAYPNSSAPLPLLGDIAARLTAPEIICISLDPENYQGAAWAVPLWSERGLIGVLLLGEKVDDSLYTQEEMEIARASGERLIDMQASAVLAQRLMALQRQRLAESQVLDRRARRMLHDDVLPRLHTAMLALSASPAGDATQDALTQLASVHHQISNLLREMPTATLPAVARLGLIGALRQIASEEFETEFDAISWQIEPIAEERARDIPSLTAEVLCYAAREAIRNAARYGHSSDAATTLHLTITARWRDGLEIVVEDDGVGIGAPEKNSGGSSNGGGSGHGLALHSTMMAVIGGSLTIESAPGEFTRVVLSLPQTGMPQTGMPQTGMPQTGSAQTGSAQTGSTQGGV